MADDLKKALKDSGLDQVKLGDLESELDPTCVVGGCASCESGTCKSCQQCTNGGYSN